MAERRVVITTSWLDIDIVDTARTGQGTGTRGVLMGRRARAFKMGGDGRERLRVLEGRRWESYE